MREAEDAVYEPGTSVAVAGPAAWVVVDVAPDHPSVGACWRAARRGAPVEDVLDALVSGGMGSAPSFALAQRQLGAWRVVVRGSGSAAVTVDGQAVQTVRAWPGTTWTDTIAVGEVEEIELGVAPDAPTGGLVLPLTSGVLMAGRLRLTTRAADVAPSSSPPPPVPAVPAPEAPVSEAPASQVQPPEEQEPEVQDSGAEALEAPEHEVEGSAAASPVVEPLADDGGSSYDHLFGATVRPGEPVAPPPPSTSGWETLPPPSEPPPSEPPPPEPVRPPVPVGGLIASFPFAVGAPAVEPAGPVTPARAAAPPAASPDVLLTTDRASLLREVAAAGPSVWASRCPSGHLSPANASLCRVCAAPVPPQPPVDTPRPVLGVLRLSTGDVVTLDRGVVLGRAPEPGDGERPHLVRLLSESGDISRVHLEVVLEGWHVLVRDLGSTNGSTVAAPGEAPVRVRAHDLVPIEPGTEVSLADEVSFRFEVTP